MPRFANVCLSERSYSVLCDAGDLELEISDFCIIGKEGEPEETGFIRSFEYRCIGCKEGANGAVPRVIRKANSREVRAWHFLKRREKEAISVCKEKALKFKLEMKISSVKFDDAQRKIVFNFTADKRVDFRELVKELAASFHARIELWQIGVRDETKGMKGYGVCGCQLCCSSWMHEFTPVSIRYAKTQDIQFSPNKLSGVCGRLRCCLAYEQEQYVEMSKDAPPVGSFVTTKDGKVKVIDRNLIRRTISIVDAEGNISIISFNGIQGIDIPDEVAREEIPVPIDPEEEARASSIYAEEESYNQRRPPRRANDSPRNGQNERPAPRPALIESEEPQSTLRDEDRPVQRDEPRRFPRDEAQPAKRERVQVILKGDSTRQEDDSRELEDNPANALSGAGGDAVSESERDSRRPGRRRGKRGGKGRNHGDERNQGEGDGIRDGREAIRSSKPVHTTGDAGNSANPAGSSAAHHRSGSPNQRNGNQGDGARPPQTNRHFRPKSNPHK